MESSDEIGMMKEGLPFFWSATRSTTTEEYTVIKAYVEIQKVWHEGLDNRDHRSIVRNEFSFEYYSSLVRCSRMNLVSRLYARSIST